MIGDIGKAFPHLTVLELPFLQSQWRDKVSQASFVIPESKDKPNNGIFFFA